MLRLNEIKSFFPAELRGNSRFMLREYLQYRILEFIYSGPFATSLNFMGGTAMRIVHGNRRFSEDLDFDNRGLNEKQLTRIAEDIRRKFQLEGYETEIKLVMRGAWHAYIKFPGLLFDELLSEYRTEKVNIRLDAEPQLSQYQPDRFILNRFEVFSTILTVPLSLLMAQKCLAILTRPRKMGRDFFDLVFLMSKGIQPDFGYLTNLAGISDFGSLKVAILKECNLLDMHKLAKEVEPFLFDARDKQKVIQFPEYFRQSFQN